MSDNVGYLNGRILAPKVFGEVFSHFYFAENRLAHTITQTLLPSYQTMLIFSFGTNALLHSNENERIEIAKCAVLGPIKKAFDYSLPPKSNLLIANFKDDAFYRFFGAASIAAHLPIDPDALLKENCFSVLWDKLNGFRDSKAQVAYLLEFCTPYLSERNAIAAQLVKLKNGAFNPIKEVANKENRSERVIQINHKKYLGYSAKEISRYQRFLHAVEMMQHLAPKATKNNWFEIIDACGYYDQSQLINDFKYYTNLSPTQYLKFQGTICNPVT